MTYSIIVMNTKESQSHVRLDRLLSNLGYASRKEIGYACRSGLVALNGVEVRDPSRQISLDLVRCGALLFRGERIDPPSPFTIMLNKPRGFICSHKEKGDLIYDLLPKRWRSRKPMLSSIGRLDKDSTGQLILTDDGDLLHRIIHPRNHYPKYYTVQVEKDLQGDEAGLFASGEFKISGDKTPLAPAQWKAHGKREGIMVLTEGRFHQIRRMFEALGNTVINLHRFQTGTLALGDLAEGEYKILLSADIEALTSAAAKEARLVAS